MTDTLTQIAIKDIVKNPFQPRANFQPEELAELAQSIKENGLIQPIIVRESDIIGYELIAGERRLRACQLAGIESIPAIIKEMSSDASMKQAIIENLQRQNLTPIEEARAYQQLMAKNQMTHDDIAKSMGKSRPYISNMLRLLHLPKDILDGLEQGKLSVGHARVLLSLTNEHEQLAWYNIILTDGLSVRQVEKRLAGKQTRLKETNLFSQDYEKQISQQLGLEVHITSTKKGKGKVTISFANQDDFNRLINKLL